MTNQEAMRGRAREFIAEHYDTEGGCSVELDEAMSAFAEQEVASRDALLEKIRQTVALLPSATALSPPPDFESIPLAIRDLQNAYKDAATARNGGISYEQLASRDARIAEVEQEIFLWKQEYAELEKRLIALRIAATDVLISLPKKAVLAERMKPNIAALEEALKEQP